MRSSVVNNPRGTSFRTRAFRVAGFIAMVAVLGLAPSCGGNTDSTPPPPVDTTAPTFTNGGMNQEPRLFPALTVDSSFNSTTSFTSFNFEIECTVVIPDTPSWTGQVIVRSGTAPLTYSMTNAPVGMTINSSTGRLTYLAPDCLESGTSKTTTFTVTDSAGKVTALLMRQIFRIIVRN
ncbi:MAG: hypothetical protein ABIP81_02360 [Terriglobales bacterium]